MPPTWNDGVIQEGGVNPPLRRGGFMPTALHHSSTPSLQYSLRGVGPTGRRPIGVKPLSSISESFLAPRVTLQRVILGVWKNPSYFQNSRLVKSLLPRTSPNFCFHFVTPVTDEYYNTSSIYCRIFGESPDTKRLTFGLIDAIHKIKS